MAYGWWWVCLLVCLWVCARVSVQVDSIHTLSKLKLSRLSIFHDNCQKRLQHFVIWLAKSRNGLKMGKDEIIEKNCQKDLIWTQYGQKEGDPIFSQAWCHNKKCTECFNLWNYAKLAKTNEVFSRTWQNTAKGPYFGDTKLNNLDTIFFSKIGLRHFSTFGKGNLSKKIRKN
jgi:hypothetical protein